MLLCNKKITTYCNLHIYSQDIICYFLATAMLESYKAYKDEDLSLIENCILKMPKLQNKTSNQPLMLCHAIQLQYIWTRYLDCFVLLCVFNQVNSFTCPISNGPYKRYNVINKCLYTGLIQVNRDKNIYTKNLQWQHLN